MKKILLLSILVLLLFVACKQSGFNTRSIHVVIPEHPWEKGSNVRLWYNLKWNENGEIKTMYLDQNTREVDIEIAKDCTVYICAYPLGEMLPFGTAVTPLNGAREVVLSQYEGYVAHLLININLEAAERVDFGKLVELVKQQMDDARMIDDAQLLADVLNGRLNGQSVKKKRKFLVENISIPDGKWVSECEYDGYLLVTNGHTEALTLAAGVFRYYCEALDREFRVVVDDNGGVFHSIRYGMIGL